MATLDTRCFDIFEKCVQAIADGELIQRVSAKDKEYHFQYWFASRLDAAGIEADEPARNSYPDYRLVHTPEGYELKALAYPGREADFDSNSQVPTGKHNGRRVFYVFGRYPELQGTGTEYPLVDLVICHGDFLNADHLYKHKNKSFRGFGSYGDILIRDRKMYVAPTPFALLSGVTALPTLIVPSDYPVDGRFQQVGKFTRVEAAQVVVAYEFDLKTNELTPKLAKNKDAGKKHEFIACRLKTASNKPVSLVSPHLPATEDADND